MFPRADWTDDLAADYFEALEDLPADLITLAVKRCLRIRERFMPTPGEIRAQVADELDQRAAKAERAARDRRIEEEQRGMRAPRNTGYDALSAEEQAAFDAKMDDYWRQMGGRPKPRGPRTACYLEDRPMRQIADVMAGCRYPQPDEPVVRKVMPETEAAR
jgi:hypothetical protein